VQATPTGAAYVEAMERDPRDREYRRAFQRLALSLVDRHGSMFDFGSGPGIDSRHYARAGRHVHAYDVDAGMCSYFEKHCASEIAAGSIRLHGGGYGEFLTSAQPSAGSMDLVVSNFAPLNLVAELPPLFEKFSSMLGAEGRVLVSVLNPFFGGLMRSRGWWLGLPALLITGRYTAKLHGILPVTRWQPARLARAAAPRFKLAAIHVTDGSADRTPRRFTRLSPRAWLAITGSEFLFLQFERPS
jgi:SAM-dependent methyltransferase